MEKQTHTIEVFIVSSAAPEVLDVVGAPLLWCSAQECSVSLRGAYVFPA